MKRASPDDMAHQHELRTFEFASNGDGATISGFPAGKGYYIQAIVDTSDSGYANVKYHLTTTESGPAVVPVLTPDAIFTATEILPVTLDDAPTGDISFRPHHQPDHDHHR
jgi:hypothetical protein